MQYAIAVFRSRNETLYLANMLINKGYNVAVVNTPREISSSCSISVRFGENILEVVRELLRLKPFRSFVGIFKVVVCGGRMSIGHI